jgi:hypothetical protein
LGSFSPAILSFQLVDGFVRQISFKEACSMLIDGSIPTWRFADADRPRRMAAFALPALLLLAVAAVFAGCETKMVLPFIAQGFGPTWPLAVRAGGGDPRRLAQNFSMLTPL